MKANENEILTIAGKRVRVSYCKQKEEVCEGCCFRKGTISCDIKNGGAWPCEMHDSKGEFAYFVPAEDCEADLEAEISAYIDSHFHIRHDETLEVGNDPLKTADFEDAARHFAEWGVEHLKR